MKTINETKMENLVKTLYYKKVSGGHFHISIEMNEKILYTITSDAGAIDAAFDEDYDDEDNSERFYSTRYEAQEALVEEILKDNDIKL